PPRRTACKRAARSVDASWSCLRGSDRQAATCLLASGISVETPAFRRGRNRTPAEQGRGSRFAARRTGVETPRGTARSGSVFEGGDNQATERTSRSASPPGWRRAETPVELV